MRKVLLYLMVILTTSATFSISSCGDDEPIIDKKDPQTQPSNNGNNGSNNITTYYFQTDTYRVGKDAGSLTIYVKSNTEWEFSSTSGNFSDFSISCPSKGSGDFSFTVSYSTVPNPYDWNEYQYVNFRVKMGSSKNPYYETKTISIYRSGKTTPV